MQTEIRINQDKNGNSIICLSVPDSKALSVLEAIKSFLTLAGHKVCHVDNCEEELVKASEVFIDTSPSKALRGLRVKEDITQIELAERLGVSQNMISDMESGKRNISLKMAKRIGKIFNLSYKIFV